MPTKVSLKKKKSKGKRAQRASGNSPAEVSTLGKLIRQIGSLGGGTLGTYVGAPAAGAAAGNSLGAAISKWLGFGDYTVGTNSIVQKASTGIPMMHKEGQTVVIRHREFIGTVSSSIGFNVQTSYVLNPGDPNTFPWLSTIANSFQEYRFKGVVFHYIPTSGNAISGTSPSLGAVMMQTSYRSNDTAPSSKSELLNEYWSGEAVPSETFAHPIECNPAENPFNVQYVRRTGVPTGDNQLFYDLGVTHVATQGQLQSGNVLGDIWVTYEVELKKPIVASNVTAGVDVFMGTAVSPTATIADLPGGLTRTSGTLLFRRTTVGTMQADRVPSGVYLFTYYLFGSSVSAGTIALTNMTQVEAYPGVSSLIVGASAGVAYTNAYRVTDSTRPVAFSFSGFSGTLLSIYFSFVKIAD